MSSFAISEAPAEYSLLAVMCSDRGNDPDRMPRAGSAAVTNDQVSAEEEPEQTAACPSDPRGQIRALYDEYRPRLFRYLCSMHVVRETAEEIIQETFMRLTTALLKRAEIDNVQGWIVRVAHNLAVDTLKKTSTAAISGDDVAYLLANRADPALNPEEAYVKNEKATQLDIALAALKPQHRQCFQMRAHGLRYKTIGKALGISEQRAAFVVKQVAVRLAALCG